MHHVFRKCVGKLMWMLEERNDVAYAVKEMARHVQDPHESHMQQLRRLVKYLVGTVHYAQELKFNSSASHDM
eukprot:586026-Heterocapsa_arctica.AAC.1